jgi:putative hydrolase of the HAD superfamily
MRYSTVFFDLDATLYDPASGLWQAIGDRINLYLHQKMGFPEARVGKIRNDYYIRYGTTLNGLLQHHQIDPAEYLDFVHDLPVRSFLKPDPDLKAMLASLPQACWVFTNSDHAHAGRVLDALGIQSCFQGVIALETLRLQSKPAPEAYETAFSVSGNPAPNQCVLLDDSLRNLAPAHALGVTTILVGPAEPDPAVDYCIPRPHGLPDILPALWQ